MPTNHSTSSAMLRPSLASLTSGPPQRASIPVLARSATSHRTSVAADPPGCRSSRGAQNTGFAGYSRQAGPVRPVYNTDQPITALKGTGIRTAGPSREKGGGCGSEVDAGAGLRGKPRTLFQEPYAIDLAGRAAVHPVVFFGTGTDT